MEGSFFTCLPEYSILKNSALCGPTIGFSAKLSEIDIKCHLDNLKAENPADDEVENDGYYPLVYCQQGSCSLDAKSLKLEKARRVWCLATRKSLISHIQSKTFFEELPPGNLSLENGLNRDLEEVVTILVTDWPAFPENVYLVFRVVHDCTSSDSTVVKLDEFPIIFGIGSGCQHKIGNITRKETVCLVLSESEDQIQDWLIQYLKNNFVSSSISL